MGNILFLCLNLERSPDRRELMEEEARLAGIKLSFIRAVDGREFNVDLAPGYDRVGRLRYAPDLKANEIACVLSHAAALRAFLDSGARAAVVLEDDAVLSDGFGAFVEAMMTLPIKWNSVNLENRNAKPIRPALINFVPGVALHASGWLSSGAAGRLYTRAGAECVLHSLRRFRHPFDTHLGFFWRRGITPLCAHPPMVSIRRGISSTITGPGDQSRLVDEKALSLKQYLRARSERIEHEIRKEVSARITFARVKLSLATGKHDPSDPGPFRKHSRKKMSE